MTSFGLLALIEAGKFLPLQVLQTGRGFYLGTADAAGPVSRESAEYWPTEADATAALTGAAPWTQLTES